MLWHLNCLKWNEVSEKTFQDIPLNFHCTFTRLHDATLHYTDIFIVTLFTKHIYIMQHCFAFLFFRFTHKTAFIIYVINIIPTRSSKYTCKNYIIQSSDVSFGNIRVTSGHIGRAWWRCICYEGRQAWVVVVLRAPLRVECTVRGGECCSVLVQE